MNPLPLCSTFNEVTQSLEVRTATTELEISQLREALNSQHYLKAGRPAGHVLWQGVYQTATEDGTPSLCAVLCWAGAALRLKDRDEWIDWDPLTRANRLALVVQLRRFLVLEESRKPNLATRCMGLAMRHLPEEWEARHGFRPLLAESFSDPQAHQGTIYKASNWTPLGFTKGFKLNRADFYQDDEHPKKLLWREDRSSLRSAKGAKNLALLRNALWPSCHLSSMARSMPHSIITATTGKNPSNSSKTHARSRNNSVTNRDLRFMIPEF